MSKSKNARLKNEIYEYKMSQDNYFELIKDPNILNNYSFWRKKLIEEYHYPEHELDTYSNN